MWSNDKKITSLRAGMLNIKRCDGPPYMLQVFSDQIMSRYGNILPKCYEVFLPELVERQGFLASFLKGSRFDKVE